MEPHTITLSDGTRYQVDAYGNVSSSEDSEILEETFLTVNESSFFNNSSFTRVIRPLPENFGLDFADVTQTEVGLRNGQIQPGSHKKTKVCLHKACIRCQGKRVDGRKRECVHRFNCYCVECNP